MRWFVPQWPQSIHVILPHVSFCPPTCFILSSRVFHLVLPCFILSSLILFCPFIHNIVILNYFLLKYFVSYKPLNIFVQINKLLVEHLYARSLRNCPSLCGDIYFQVFISRWLSYRSLYILCVVLSSHLNYINAY